MKKMKVQILFTAVLLGNPLFMQGMVSRSTQASRQLMRRPVGVRLRSDYDRDMYPTPATPQEQEEVSKLKVGVFVNPRREQERREMEQEKLSTIEEDNEEPQEESWVSRFIKYIFGSSSSDEEKERKERLRWHEAYMADRAKREEKISEEIRQARLEGIKNEAYVKDLTDKKILQLTKEELWDRKVNKVYYENKEQEAEKRKQNQE